MQVREQVPLSELTTLRVGGPARRLITAATIEEVVEVVGGADAAGEPLLIIAGGSNLLIGDQGFDGTVLQIALGGIDIGEAGDGVRVAAGAWEPWDAVVAACVDEGLAGVECLSGIPGSTGATPIQNVGAYGQDVSETIVSVSAYDRRAGTLVVLEPQQCGFGYRSSAFKGSDRYVVLRVAFELERSQLARGIRYAELARTLAVERVLALRLLPHAKRCSSSGAARAWCLIPTTLIRSAPGRSSLIRSCRARRSRRSSGARRSAWGRGPRFRCGPTPTAR